MSNRSRKAAGRAGKLAVAAGAVFLTTRHGWADTIWQAGTDTWFNDANWSGDQPTSTSTADINNSGTADIASGLASTNVLNLGQAAGQSGSVAITGGTLSVATVEEPGVLVGGYEYIGLSGTGSFIQSGGFNDNSSGRGIYLGENAGSTGEYSLCNGGVLAGSLFVGDSGAGIFNQVDGICTVYSLYVGHEGGSTGTYTLQSGILSAYVTSLSACNEYIGYAGGSNGTFIQNGGANLLLGAFTELYVEGTYLLNNGELADSTTEFIDGGGASLIQSGGVNTVGTLAVGGQISGTYALQAGTLTAGVINLGVVISPDPLLYGTGAFTQTGGTLSFETFNQGGGIVTLSPLVLSNGMAYNLNFGTLTTPSITISTGGTLTMSQGTLNAVIINVEAGGTFVEAGAISCTSLNQTGGTVNWDSVNISGTDVPMYEFTNVPNYNYSSGLFTVNTEYVGTDNVAEYTQTMGVNDPVELNIGYNPGETGTYVLTGSGTLEATETVGFQGVGTLNQTGGTNLAANLSIGTNGAYLLSGGVLNAGVINSSGVFNQTGGSLSFGTFNQNGGNLSFGALTLQGGGPDINFMLNGGTLNCPTITVNSGGTFAVGRGTLLCTTLNQSGGLVSFNSASISGANTPIYDFAGIQNYNFSGGTFAVGTEYVGFGGTASYSQSVNQNDPGTLTLGYGKSDSGTYTLTANGQLSAVEFIGYSGNGLFNQSGGSNYSGTGSFYLGYNAGSTGTYILSGTAYFNPSEVYVGDNGVGVFNQTGGTNATVPILGANSGATGTYILSGGVLQQTVEVGAGGVGVFNQSGGINQGSRLEIGFATRSQGTYFLSGTGAINSPQEYIGDSGTGNFIENGGSNTTSEFYCPESGSGQYTLNSGSLNCSDVEDIEGSGSFVQQGGTNTVTTAIEITGSGTASYTLAAGVVSTTNEFLGPGTTSTFVQLGGTNTLTGTLHVGDAGGGVANYALSGGTLTAVTESLDNGSTCMFTQSGGSNSISGTLSFGPTTYGAASYALSAGIVSAGTEYLGNQASSVFSQTGGTNTVRGTLTLTESNSPNHSSYTLNSGLLTAVAEVIGGGGTTTYTQTGGANSINQLQIGYSTSNGVTTFGVSGGTLNVTGSLTLMGSPGMTTLSIANMTVNAGSVSNSELISLTDPAPAGSAGDLDVTGNFLQTSTGKLSLTIGGPVADSTYTVLSIVGSASVAGTLSLTIANGFVPYYHEQFDIIDAKSLSGSFASVTLPGGTKSYSLSYTTTGVVLTALPEPAGFGLLAGGALMLAVRRRKRQ